MPRHKTVIHWFRRDLRLTDNPALTAAAKDGARVVPCYVLSDWKATHGWTGIFKRPGSQTPVQGLYLAGGSVHPGPGVPMAALSGQLAAEAMLANPALTRRSRPVATFGGMSTP